MFQPLNERINYTAKEYRDGLLNDPATHNWVKKAILELDNHDAVDACYDSQMVAVYCKLKLNELQREVRP